MALKILNLCHDLVIFISFFVLIQKKVSPQGFRSKLTCRIALSCPLFCVGVISAIRIAGNIWAYVEFEEVLKPLKYISNISRYMRPFPSKLGKITENLIWRRFITYKLVLFVRRTLIVPIYDSMNYNIWNWTFSRSTFGTSEDPRLYWYSFLRQLIESISKWGLENRFKFIFHLVHHGKNVLLKSCENIWIWLLAVLTFWTIQGAYPNGLVSLKISFTPWSEISCNQTKKSPRNHGKSPGILRNQSKYT